MDLIVSVPELICFTFEFIKFNENKYILFYSLCFTRNLESVSLETPCIAEIKFLYKWPGIFPFLMPLKTANSN